jgi:hypothetical protein
MVINQTMKNRASAMKRIALMLMVIAVIGVATIVKPGHDSTSSTKTIVKPGHKLASA